MKNRTLAAAVVATYALSLASNSLISEYAPRLGLPFISASAETAPADYSFSLQGVLTEEGGVSKNARMRGTISLAPNTTVALAPSPAPAPEPAPAPAPAPAAVEIWWPVDNVTVAADQPFKALLPSRQLSDYSMYWQVDQGQTNAMPDNFADAPHKEALVNLSSWTWRGSGPYHVTFAAKDKNAVTIATRTITLYVDNGLPRQSTKVSQATAPAEVVLTSNVSMPITNSAASNPLASRPLWVPPNSARIWVDANRSSRPAEAALVDSKIASRPQAKWLGDWNQDIRSDVAAAVNHASQAGAMPVFVLYNIPMRDCGSYSAGGAKTPDAYRDWVTAIAETIGSRAAAVVLEPDGLSIMDCLSAGDKIARLGMLHDAVRTLSSRGIATYIDAGHPSWISAAEMANRLKNSGIDRARGFALNVSNFYTDDSNVSFGVELSGLIGGKPFVVDRSRNGNGPTPDSQWCNPSGRALGLPPTASTGNPLVDGFLWLKTPGESDGACNGGPSAGTFWPEYALGLAQRARW